MVDEKKRTVRGRTFRGVVIDGFKVKKKAYKVGDKYSTKNEQLFNNLINLSKIKK